MPPAVFPCARTRCVSLLWDSSRHPAGGMQTPDAPLMHLSPQRQAGWCPRVHPLWLGVRGSGPQGDGLPRQTSRPQPRLQSMGLVGERGPDAAWPPVLFCLVLEGIQPWTDAETLVPFE